MFNQVKDRLRCSIGQSSTEFDAMCTPQSDGKRERLCFIERKDKSFVSNCRDFRREMFLFFDLSNGKTKTRGLFFELPLVSLIALLLFVAFSPSFAPSSPAPSWVPPRA